jgi:hypothetical protein
LEKDKNDDVLADSHNIVDGWQNCFLSYYIGFGDVKRWKYMQLSHWYLNLVLLALKLLLKFEEA